MKTIKQWIETIADDYTRNAALEKFQQLHSRTSAKQFPGFAQAVLTAWADAGDIESISFGQTYTTSLLTVP